MYTRCNNLRHCSTQQTGFLRRTCITNYTYQLSVMSANNTALCQRMAKEWQKNSVTFANIYYMHISAQISTRSRFPFSIIQLRIPGLKIKILTTMKFNYKSIRRNYYNYYYFLIILKYHISSSSKIS